jgi:hypothetical protein
MKITMKTKQHVSCCINIMCTYLSVFYIYTFQKGCDILQRWYINTTKCIIIIRFNDWCGSLMIAVDIRNM